MKLFKSSILALIISTTSLFSFNSNAHPIQSINVIDQISNTEVSINISFPNEALQEPLLHTINNDNIKHYDGFMYCYILPSYIAEHIENNGPLSAVLFENGTLLNHLNCYHGLIVNQGMGLTSFYQNGNLYFSTSDNTPIQDQTFIISLSIAFNEQEIELHNGISGEHISKKYAIPNNPEHRLKIDLNKIQPFGTYGYQYKLPELVTQTINEKDIYAVALIENNTILHKVNCFHGIIQETGIGHVSFFENGTLYFSTSDNSPLDGKDYYIVFESPTLDDDEQQQPEIIQLEIEQPLNIDVIANEITDLILANSMNDAARRINDPIIDQNLKNQIMGKIAQNLNDFAKLGEFMIAMAQQPAIAPPPPLPAPMMNPPQAAPRPRRNVQEMLGANLPQNVAMMDMNFVNDAIKARAALPGNRTIVEVGFIAENRAKIEALMNTYRVQFDQEHVRADIFKLNVANEKARLENFCDDHEGQYNRLVFNEPGHAFIAEYAGYKDKIIALKQLLHELGN